MIDFVYMQSGRKMPVEIEKPIRIVVKAQDSIIPGDETYRLVSGFIPHWLNCPHAKEFKKHG